MLCCFYRQSMSAEQWRNVRDAVERVCRPLDVDLTLISYRQALVINDSLGIGESFALSAGAPAQSVDDVCNPVTADQKLAILCTMSIVAYYAPHSRRIIGPETHRGWAEALHHVRQHAQITPNGGAVAGVEDRYATAV